MGHFGHKTRWKHSCLHPTHLEVKARSKSGQIRLNRQTQNFHCETCLCCPVFPQDSQNDDYFDVRWLEMPKNCILKTAEKLSRTFSETPAFKSNSFSQQDVLLIRIWVISKPWRTFSGFLVINFGHLSGRIKSVCGGNILSPSLHLPSFPGPCGRSTWAGVCTRLQYSYFELRV